MRIDGETDGQTRDETGTKKLIVSILNFASNTEKTFVSFAWIPAQTKIILLPDLCNRD